MATSQYTSHDDDRLLETTHGMQVTGGDIMVGRYADDTLELMIYTEEASTPTGAQWAFEDGALPRRLLTPQDRAAIEQLTD